MSKIHELYHCKYKGEIIYIGHGARGRHRHCDSGCSHVYKLNKIHFSEGKGSLYTEVIEEFNDKDSAKAKELLEIQKYRPSLNKVHNGCNNRQLRADESKALKAELIGKYNKLCNSKTTEGKQEKYRFLVEEFYRYFSYNSIKDKEFILFGESFYKRQGFYYLRNLVTTIKTQGLKNRSDNNPYLIFIKAMYICCDIDLSKHLVDKPPSLESNYCLEDLNNETKEISNAQ